MNGFIKLHRKLLDWQWYCDAVVKCVFLHLLLTASYKEKKWRDITLTPGQIVTSQKALSSVLGFSVQQIKTALLKLQSTGEITCRATNKYTVISIVKWEDYQIFEIPSTYSLTNEQPTNNQQITNEQLTNNQQITTSKEYKNINNIINNNQKVMFVDACEKLKKSLNPCTYNAWFSSLELVQAQPLVLAVDRAYTKKVIESEFMDKVQDAFSEFGSEFKIISKEK